MRSDNFTNLTVHRTDVDAWRPKGWWDRGVDDRVTLSLVSMAGVSLLVYAATRRRSGSSLWRIVSGASLLGCAAAGLGTWLRGVRSGAEQSPVDVVTQESLDSFPASDAPSSNATTATPQPLRSGDDAH